MKKLISILLALALVFTLCACRKKDNDKKEDNPSEGGTSDPAPENPWSGGGGIETPIIPLD